MYRKDSEGWLKHVDFIVLDMICLQLAFILAYAFRGYGFNVYGDILYRNMAIFLGFADLVVIFTSGTMKSVLKRGHYKEFVSTLKNAVIVGALAIAYLFIIQEGQSFSRMILITTIVIYLILTYAIREIWKNSLHKKMENGGDKKLLIITSKAVAENVVHSMQENNYARYSLAGVVVIDEDCTGEKICGVPVVAGESDVPMYVCQEWIDEVLIVISEDLPYPDGLIDKLTETGVTVHMNLAKITNQTGKRQFVEKVGSYTVLTTSLNYASFGQLFLKRLMDICGGLVGCIFTGIITIFVGPAIYLASPGPIFFSQERVGKNGKKFKMYKFRSMYMDAEARKAELMKENKLGDGKMFKMDFDPRVIGNKVLPDGTHKTGVGDFIRRTSLDEFPQFFNVLKGDMSIVGTRPPLISETNLYEPHHKVRLDEWEHVTFSYYRERIMKTSRNFRWQGRVHETVVPAGNILYSDVVIEHRKIKAGESFRNLHIYEQMIDAGEKMEPRHFFYYGRELFYHKQYEYAILILKKFLEEPDGWIEDKLNSCLVLSCCYQAMGENAAAFDILFYSFTMDVPRAEICCEIGRLFMEKREYTSTS